ncbi:MAG: hypothetical protein WBI07_14470 [Mobilitalea sp.]
MRLGIVWILVLSLTGTLLVEVIFAFAAGIRNKKDFALISLVNVLTNPAVVLLYYLMVNMTGGNRYIIIIPLETIAVFVEAAYYRKYGDGFKHPLLFSIGANLCSYSIGVAIGFLI